MSPRKLKEVFAGAAPGSAGWSGSVEDADLRQAFDEWHDSVLAAIDTVGRRLDKQDAALDDLSRQITCERLGAGAGSRQAPAALDRAYAQFREFARTGALASMGTDSNPDGGYLVPEEIEQQIGQIARNISPMRALARTVQTTAGVYKLNLWIGDAGAGWVGERQARPETNAQSLVELTFPAHELYCMPAATQMLLDDARVNMAQELAFQAETAFRRLEDAAWINGDGINKPRGILTYPITSQSDAARSFGALAYVPTGVADKLGDANTPAGDNLLRLFYSLKAEYRQNATWQMNSDTARVVSTIKDAEGRYYWRESLQAGQPPTLLGRPVALNENLPPVDADTLPIWLGDWSRGYLIVDRIGIRVLRDPFTNKPLVYFYTTKRVGGGLVDSNAIKALKIATN